MSVPVTTIILTKNEELNVSDCLDAITRFSDDVFVLDSGSTDRTREIARQHGVTVFENPFTGFGDQRNWAVDHIPHRYEWVLHLDADEPPTDAIVRELDEIVGSDPEDAGFYVPSKLMLGERWLRYSGGYPVYQVRLFHRQRLRFVNHGHGQREVTDGRIRYLREPYLHYAFSKGTQDWFEKHVRYAAAEAMQVQSERSSFMGDLRQCLTCDPIQRRRAAKRLSFRFPARPYLRFVQMLFLKRGLLDGRAGIAYARMMAAYEAMFAAYVSAMKAGVDVSDEKRAASSEEEAISLQATAYDHSSHTQ